MPRLKLFWYYSLLPCVNPPFQPFVSTSPLRGLPSVFPAGAPRRIALAICSRLPPHGEFPSHILILFLFLASSTAGDSARPSFFFASRGTFSLLASRDDRNLALPSLVEGSSAFFTLFHMTPPALYGGP